MDAALPLNIRAPAIESLMWWTASSHSTTQVIGERQVLQTNYRSLSASYVDQLIPLEVMLSSWLPRPLYTTTNVEKGSQNVSSQHDMSMWGLTWQFVSHRHICTDAQSHKRDDVILLFKMLALLYLVIDVISSLHASRPGAGERRTSSCFCSLSWGSGGRGVYFLLFG